MSDAAAPESNPELESVRRERARQRRAIVASQITQASDALAAADLLLGMNQSLLALARGERR